MQKRYEIYNRAFSFLNRDPKSEKEWEEDTDSKDRLLADLWYQTAFDKVRTEKAWSFLQEELTMGEDEGKKAGFAHSYALPYDMFRICNVIYRNGEEDENHFSKYRCVNGYLLSEDPVDCVYGMMNDMPYDGIPEEFYVLVSLALAVILAPGMGFNQQSIAIIERQYYEHLNKQMYEDSKFTRRDRIS